MSGKYNVIYAEPFFSYYTFPGTPSEAPVDNSLIKIHYDTVKLIGMILFGKYNVIYISVAWFLLLHLPRHPSGGPRREFPIEIQYIKTNQGITL